MTDEVADGAEAADGAQIPREPDIDESGVDLAQIRQMLNLTPAERLSTIARFTGSLIALRSPDEARRSG